jgi:hypothetical protein
VFGTYYREGDELIFHAQIADARSGVVLTALEPVRTTAASPLDGIEELRRRTLTALGPILDPRMAVTAGLSSQPPSYGAYRDYADGLELFIAGDLPAARERFELAAAADPSYTLPLLWAALARWNSGDHFGGDSLARQVSNSGVKLAPLDDAILRSILAWANGDWAAAYDAAARAHHAAPGSGTAAAQLAVEAMRLNRPAESRRILVSLDPDQGDLRGWAYYWQDLAEAHHLLASHRPELAVAREANRRHPGSAVARLIQVRALAATGRIPELHATLDDVLASSAAPLFGTLCREAAQELIAHARPADAIRVLDRGIAWFRQRISAVPDDDAAVRGLVRLLMIRGQDAEAADMLGALTPPTRAPGAVDHFGQLALLAQRAAETGRADELLQRLEDRGVAFTRGRDAWWRAAVLGARGDCDGALDAMRAGLSRGIEFGLELHHAHELHPLRSCAGWSALVRPRG